jgi:hypothetical protein
MIGHVGQTRRMAGQEMLAAAVGLATIGGVGDQS